MAHELQEFDNVVLHKDAAWHGLGIVVDDAPTPQEALKIAGLDWSVEQWPLSATDGEKRLLLDDQQLNVRSDISHPLGIVGSGYKPIQNSELADFCECLAEQGDVVKIESAGSIRNGAKVWFLLKGESFAVRSEDEVSPYICVSNGHDGITALRCTPTSIRVVCSNTLHLVIPQNDSARSRFQLRPCSYIASHTGNVKGKVDDAKAALGLYNRSLDSGRGMIDALAARELGREDVQRFFLECYATTFEPIPDNPKDSKQANARRKATEAYNCYLARFETEMNLAGSTAWNALNAFTGWMQHDRGTKSLDVTVRRDRQISSNLFGENAQRSLDAMKIALSL